MVQTAARALNIVNEQYINSTCIHPQNFVTGGNTTLNNVINFRRNPEYDHINPDNHSQN